MHDASIIITNFQGVNVVQGEQRKEIVVVPRNVVKHHLHEFVSVWPLVFMPETQGMANLMGNGSNSGKTILVEFNFLTSKYPANIGAATKRWVSMEVHT